MPEIKYKPNGVEGECQCVRNHSTFIDGDLRQCRVTAAESGQPLINGLCSGCHRIHGEMLRIKSAAEIERENA